MRILSTPWSLATAALLGATAAVAARPLVAADVDYTKLPPDAATVCKQVEEKQYSLTKAIEAAAKKTGGIAMEAALNVDTGTVEVKCATPTAMHRVQVDAVSGEVKDDVALPQIPGAALTGALTSTPSGLRYCDLKVGDGDTPTPTSTVKVHYTGWLVDGKKFDSSVDRGEPATFPLNGVIPGWTEGVGSMKVGGKRKLVIPAALGYRERGVPGLIPPQALLVFDVELVEIVRK